MLTIRSDQWDTLQEPKIEELLLYIETHLKKYFPNRTQGMGPEKLRGFVVRSYECCEDLGITRSASICKLTDMRLVLGENFYQSTDYPWAARILYDESITDINDRVEQMSLIAAKL